MKGSTLISILLGCAILMGAGLWYTSTKAYYRSVTGVTSVSAYGDAFPVSNYKGIDADTSPLKLRACFNVDWDYFPSDEFKDVATPLTAPKWFDCFDARQIGEDLLADKASAILADENAPYGFDTFIAQYPDGRAYMWRQINICGEAFFGGDATPKECPAPPVKDELSKAVDPAKMDIKLTSTSGAVEGIGISNPIAFASKTNFHACFEVDMSLAMITETYKVMDTITPTPPTADLPCFKAAQVTEDVRAGNALAVMGQKNITDGVDRLVAIYDDGRAFAWNQKAAD